MKEMFGRRFFIGREAWFSSPKVMAICKSLLKGGWPSNREIFRVKHSPLDIVAMVSHHYLY